jgi:hypothetical protein
MNHDTSSSSSLSFSSSSSSLQIEAEEGVVPLGKISNYSSPCSASGKYLFTHPLAPSNMI